MITSRIPNGCDQQGRYPQAAECCTELGQDEPEFYGREYWKEEIVSITIMSVCLVAVLGVLAMLFAG